MAIDVDNVCTHQDLADEIGGAVVLEQLLTTEWADEVTATDRSAALRQAALSDCLRSLERRQPPIFEQDISNVSELKTAVTYNALMRIYRMAMSDPSDVFAEKWRHYQREFRDEIMGVKLMVNGGPRASAYSIKVGRR